MKTEYAKTQPAIPSTLKREIDFFANSTSQPLYLKQRAMIIKLSSEGKNDRDIAKEVGMHFTNVGIWRRRFLEGLDELLLLLDQEKIREVRSKIKIVLSDKRRSGRPKKFKNEKSNL